MLQAVVDLSTVDPSWPGNGRWRLGQAQGEPGAMVLPVETVFVHHTFSVVQADWRRSIGDPCDFDQRRFGKVSYSHMLDLASRILCEVEGTHRGAHTIDSQGRSLNGVSFGLAVVGNFTSDNNEIPQTPLTDDDVACIAEAITTAYVTPGLVTPDFRILGHHDSGNATACPGDRLYARLDDVRALVQHPTTKESETSMIFGSINHPTRGQLAYVIGDDKAAWEYSRDGLRSVGGEWTDAGDVTLHPDDTVSLFGRGLDGALWELKLDVNGTPASQASWGGHIFPPA